MRASVVKKKMNELMAYLEKGVDDVEGSSDQEMKLSMEKALLAMNDVCIHMKAVTTSLEEEASNRKRINPRSLRIFRAFDYTCRVCGHKDTEDFFDAHHITDRNEMPNGGYVKENGITVCNNGEYSCHMKVEKFHISNGLEWEDGLHPENLYEMIGSSYKIAVLISNQLKSMT